MECSYYSIIGNFIFGKSLYMNSDITFECENMVFNFRVATIIKNGDKILVQKDDRVSHVTLPGGRCSLGEDTTETSVREFKEETDINCLFVKSLGMIENFFVSSFNGKNIMKF